MYEQTSMISTPQAEAKPAARYYEINEDTARNAHYCVHMSDYQPGSATNGYRAAVDKAAALVEARKAKVSPYYHDKLDALLDRYARRLAQWTNDYNRNQASYPSQFIAGAGNYNMKKHNRQMAREGDLWKEYDEVKGLLDRIKSIGTGPVDLADPHARELLEDQLQRLKDRLETDKAMNAHYRKHKTMKGFRDMPDEAAARMDKAIAEAPAFAQRPMPDFELTSLRGKIKRVQARLEELEKLRAGDAPEGWKFDGGEVVINTDLNRLQIVLDGRPDDNMKQVLKSRGFRWAPSQGAWQRQLTDNAIYAAKIVTGGTE